MILLARLVRLVVAVVVLILLAGVLLVVLEGHAQPVTDAARRLAQPFRHVFSPEDRKLRVALNWGLAAIVYSVAGALVTGLLERGSRIGPLGGRV